MAPSTTPALHRPRVGLLITLVALAVALFASWSPSVAVDPVNTTADGAEPHSPNRNQPTYWQQWLGDGSNCWKADLSDTPYTLGPAPGGRQLTLLVIKSGAGASANAYWRDPAPGKYAHPSGKQTSHVIVCTKASDPSTTPTTESTTPTTESTTPTTDPTTTRPSGVLAASGELPATGSNNQTALTGVALLAAGLALTLVARRRSAPDRT